MAQPLTLLLNFLAEEQEGIATLALTPGGRPIAASPFDDALRAATDLSPIDLVRLQIIRDLVARGISLKEHDIETLQQIATRSPSVAPLLLAPRLGLIPGR